MLVPSVVAIAYFLLPIPAYYRPEAELLAM